jgi:hypothetical protein
VPARPQQRRRLEHAAHPDPNLPGPSYCGNSHSNENVPSGPGDGHQRSLTRARRERVVASRGRRLERFRARREAIAAANRLELEHNETGGENGGEEELITIPEERSNAQPPAEDISGEAKKLSPPVQKARLLLMVSMVCSIKSIQ